METFISKISLLQPPSWKSRKYGVNIIYILETLLYLFGGYYILHMYIYIHTASIKLTNKFPHATPYQHPRHPRRENMLKFRSVTKVDVA